MEQVKLTRWEAEVATHIGAQRMLESLKYGYKTKHGFEGDPWEANVEGAAAEIAAARKLGLYWPMTVNTFKDPDLGTHIQVRRRSQSWHELLVRPEDNSKHVMVLVIGKVPLFTVHGWLPIGEVKQHMEWYKTFDERPKAWFAPQRFLRPLGDLLPYLNGTGAPRSSDPGGLPF